MHTQDICAKGEYEDEVEDKNEVEQAHMQACSFSTLDETKTKINSK